MHKTHRLMGIAMTVACFGCNVGAPSDANSADHMTGSNQANEAAISRLLVAGFDEQDARLRGMERLRGAEISRLIVGRTMREDRRGLRGQANPQSERFLPHGIVRTQLDRFSVEGTYSVQSNALCVTLQGIEEPYCRAFYRNRAGQFFQIFYGRQTGPMPILIN
ncbi:MAG TPA: hypothetical protein VEX35_13590 [Allosphingosinicella sp.]|nr:hypothetical protein [Allosphingosinicella sp.]